MIAAFASILLASSSSVPTETTKQDIIVVGRAIQTAKDSLNACLARHCPPNEDIDASLAVAESQLVAGKYRDARLTLLAALGRNRHEAQGYPIPLSDLYRANGRVAAHLGYDDDFYRSTWGIYRTLKKGLPDAKELQLSAMMEVAEMIGKTRGHTEARLNYERIAHQARRDGRPDIAALAELRLILRHMPPYLRENMVKKIAYSTDPKTRAAQLEGRLALARIAFDNKEIEKGDSIIRDLAQLNIQKPILVYAPAWEVNGSPDSTNAVAQFSADTIGASEAASGADSDSSGRSVGGKPGPHFASGPGGQMTASSHMALNVEDMWIDVGFRIGADGKVSDLEVLRSHGDTAWAKPLLASIGGRRYTPAQANSPTSYRKERYTYTSALESGIGTKMAQHSPQARVEYFDLSDISAAN